MNLPTVSGRKRSAYQQPQTFRNKQATSSRRPRKRPRERFTVFEILEHRTLLSVISGRSFEDLSADGFSPDDLPIAGRTINVYEDDGDGTFDPAWDTFREGLATGSDGSYESSCYGVGTFFIEEQLPSGWIQTAGPITYTITITDPSIDFSGNDFGSFRLGSISGQAFRDDDGDGAKSTGELGLSGRTLTLVWQGSATSQQVATDADGNFSFDGLEPGLYELSQSEELGWTSTTPNPSSTLGFRNSWDGKGIRQEEGVLPLGSWVLSGVAS